MKIGAQKATDFSALHTSVIHCMLGAIMSNARAVFQKVGECLYRYSSNGVYYARFKSDGKEIVRSLRTTDPGIARRSLAQLKAEFGGIDGARGKCTIAELADEYLRTAQHQKPATLELKKLIARRIKNEWPTGPLTQVSRIRPSHVRAWLAHLFSGKARYRSRSHNMHLAAIKQILERALDDGIIAFNPVAKLKPIKLERPIRKTPSFDEFKAIVTSIRQQQFSDTAEESADYVEFLGLAGLGQAEAASLTWGDINWKANTITTFRHKTKTGFQIPIYPQVRPLLERRFAASNGAADEKVFSVKNAKKAIASACKRLRLPAYLHRSFRRMFITRAIELGVDVKVIAEWQGHRDGGQLILSTYSHVRPVHSQRMALLMTDEVSSSSKVVLFAGQ
jgi:integrase